MGEGWGGVIKTEKRGGGKKKLGVEHSEGGSGCWEVGHSTTDVI